MLFISAFVFVYCLFSYVCIFSSMRSLLGEYITSLQCSQVIADRSLSPAED